MEAKLTIKLDQNIIQRAKRYAQRKNTSLSKLVEQYFNSLTDDYKDIDIPVTSVVKELSGIIDEKDIETSKEIYTDYLLKKYK